jgi:hypothetical protein
LYRQRGNGGNHGENEKDRLNGNEYNYLMSVAIWVYGNHSIAFNGKEKIKWHDTWRLIIYRITHVLGGDLALYFPDNMSDLSSCLPTEYDMPEFDQLIRIISTEYSPLVIDKLEDISGDLLQIERDKLDNSVPVSR